MQRLKENLIIKIVMGISIFSLIVSLIAFINKPIESEFDGSLIIQLIDLNGEVLSEKEMFFNQGDVFFDLLKSNYNVVYEDNIFGAFIIAIDDLDSRLGETIYISIYINNIYSTVGVSQIELTNGILISFVLIDWSA